MGNRVEQLPKLGSSAVRALPRMGNSVEQLPKLGNLTAKILPEMGNQERELNLDRKKLIVLLAKGHSKQKIADELNISRRTLYSYLKKYPIQENEISLDCAKNHHSVLDKSKQNDDDKTLITDEELANFLKGDEL